MKKLILLSILFIFGCKKYSPTDHTHETTGICVLTQKTISDSELNEYGCIKEGEYQYKNDAGEPTINVDGDSTYIVNEYYCEFNSIINSMDPTPKPINFYWISDASCQAYCENIISIDTEASCEITEQ